jgi:hypothetical protein
MLTLTHSPYHPDVAWDSVLYRLYRHRVAPGGRSSDGRRSTPSYPLAQRVGFMERESDSFSRFLPNIEEASRALGLQVTAIPFRNSLELARGIDAFAARPDGGLVIPPGPPSVLGTAVNTLAIQYRLPAVYGFRTSATEGGLIAYAPRLADQIVRAASFVDRVPRGAKPGDLPVEYPTRFELIVNLKTAKAIGVTIPEYRMKRREFTKGLGGAAGWPLATRAQQGDHPRTLSIEILSLKASDRKDPPIPQGHQERDRSQLRPASGRIHDNQTATASGRFVALNALRS